MIKVEDLNPKYIMANGRYWDYDSGHMFLMKPDEILRARKYFNDPNLAKNVNIKENMEYKEPIVSDNYISKQSDNVTKDNIVDLNEYRKFKLTQEQPYNDGNYQMLKPKSSPRFRKLIIMGLTIFVVATSFLNISHGEIISNNDIQLANEPSIVESISIVNDEETIQDEMKRYISKYAKIYHLNETITYNKLFELTNNFTSDEFLSQYTCKDLTCKGYKVFANNYEEFVLYFMRALKQNPEIYGLNREELVDHVDYKTPGNVEDGSYARVIGDICSLLVEDPCLIYSIVEADTDWNSNNLLLNNNPANLVIDDSLGKFDTYEEGIIETILQIKSYRYEEANSVEEMARLHVNGSEEELGNLRMNWIKKVNGTYERIFDNQRELFGKVYVTNEVLDF